MVCYVLDQFLWELETITPMMTVIKLQSFLYFSTHNYSSITSNMILIDIATG